MTQQRSDFRLKSQIALPENSSFDTLLERPLLAAPMFQAINVEGLPYPPGLSSNILVPEIEVPTGFSRILDYAVYTDGLQVNSDCDVLDVNIRDLIYETIPNSGVEVHVNITSSDCKLDLLSLAYFEIGYSVRPHWATFQWCACSQDLVHYDLSMGFPSGDELFEFIQSDPRFFMAIIEVEPLPEKATMDRLQSHKADQITAALCRPTYFIDRFETRKSTMKDGSAKAFHSPITGQPKSELSGFPSELLGAAIMAVFSQFDGPINTESPSFFDMMSWINGNSTIEPMMDSDLLVALAKKTFEGVGALLFSELVLRPENRNVSGTITWIESRLRLRLASTVSICILLAILASLALMIISAWPASSNSAPDTIASIAASLDSHLEKVEKYFPAPMRKQIRTPPINSVPDEPMSGLRNPKERQSHSVAPSERERRNLGHMQRQKNAGDGIWWYSSAGSLWFMILIIGLPLASIIGLEATQHFSDRHSGIANLKGSILFAAMPYIPMIVAVVTGIIWASLESISITFAPFVALRNGRASTSRSIGLQFQGKLLPHAFYLAIKHNHYPTIAALLGNFLTRFLTIIAVGLITVVGYRHEEVVTVSRGDTLMITVDGFLSGVHVSMISSSIEFEGLNSSEWTYEGLVFNRLNQPAAIATIEGNNSTLSTKIPAIRPRLNCTALESTKRIANETDGYWTHEESDYINVEYRTILPSATWCETPLPGNMSQTPIWIQNFPIPKNGTIGIIERANSMLWYRDESPGEVRGDFLFGSPFPSEARSGCPQFSVTFGWAKVLNSIGQGNQTKYEIQSNLGTILCHQNLEQVDVDVRFNLPEYSLDSSHIPIPDETSAKPIHQSNGLISFEFDQTNFIEAFSYHVLHKAVTVLHGSAPVEEPLLKAAVLGRESCLADNLIGEENTGNLSTAIDGMYQRFMAQAISTQMRVDLEHDGLPDSFKGSLTVDGIERLVQDRTSKNMLQVILGILIGCAIINYCALPFRDTLPCNPNSIAGIAVLIHRGSLLPKRKHESKQKESRLQIAIIDTKTYSLKWWREPEGTMRYGIDVDTNDSISAPRGEHALSE
ncbi:hypothetical protein HJFPF1_13393 [Paramyrothecium foliicola]|nr:hypothetical protein HJFPF1_13393 [Paramyrothecium foliicola]